MTERPTAPQFKMLVDSVPRPIRSGILLDANHTKLPPGFDNVEIEKQDLSNDAITDH